MRIAHFAFDFRAGDESSNRVDHDHIHRVGANQQLADFQRLLAGVRLADQQIVELHAEPLGPGWIERMLGVDERRDATQFLCAGDDVQAERGFPRRFRPENL